jgi:2-methylisocitrate lyase-like PEP mutase family enzyme
LSLKDRPEAIPAGFFCCRTVCKEGEYPNMQLSQTQKVDAFRTMHIPGNPLVLYNIWDPGSAVAVAKAGAKAIATGSWGVACAMGYKDGETLPLDLALDNLARIVGVTDLPVTVDMEAGYGRTPAEVGASIARAANAGAVGINIEDKDPATRVMLATADQCARLSAAAASGLFVNARCDLFIVTPPDRQDVALADQVIERALDYSKAGANSLFVPFVRDITLVERICAASPLPVNILVGALDASNSDLAKCGVARISYGHGPWAKAMATLEEQAREIYA